MTTYDKKRMRSLMRISVCYFNHAKQFHPGGIARTYWERESWDHLLFWGALKKGIEL